MNITPRDSNGFTDRIDLGAIMLMDLPSRFVLFTDGSRTTIPDAADFRGMVEEWGDIGVRIATTDRIAVRCDAVVRVTAEPPLVYLGSPVRVFALRDCADAEALMAALIAPPAAASPRIAGVPRVPAPRIRPRWR